MGTPCERHVKMAVWLMSMATFFCVTFMTGASGKSKCENGSAAILVNDRLAGVASRDDF